MGEQSSRVSVIIPVIREEMAKRCIEAIHRNAGIPEENLEVLFQVDTERIGVPKMVKRLVERTHFENVCFLGDDTIPQPGFLDRALQAMRSRPECWGMVSFNDNPHAARTASHWLCSKKLLPLLDGEFFHTGYHHCFCDNELMIRCQQMEKFVYAYDACIIHDHEFAFNGKSLEDASPDLKRAYSFYDEDHALFQKRMANGWKTPKDGSVSTAGMKVAIGIPSGDMVHTDFAMALVNLCLRSMFSGIQLVIINQKSSIIECGRNTIVQEALAHGADYLLTLDSDMVFPPDLLLTLLAHGKDYVCCNAARKRKPFGSVLKNAMGAPLENKGKGLYKLTGNGTAACQLTSRKLLESIAPPHYAVTWDEKGTTFTGEDYYFARKDEAAGFSLYCDTSVNIGHLGITTYFVPTKS